MLLAPRLSGAASRPRAQADAAHEQMRCRGCGLARLNKGLRGHRRYRLLSYWYLSDLRPQAQSLVSSRLVSRTAGEQAACRCPLQHDHGS